MILKIGNHEVKIEDKSADDMVELTGQESLGCFEACEDGVQRICILDTVKAPVPRQTVLMHEIIEAINGIYELGMNHKAITVQSEVILQLMRDNKKFFGKILE